jgi:hypothetical protein
VIDDVLSQVEKVWPELGGGFIAYCMHAAFHGVYHRVLHSVVRLMPRRRSGGR